MKTYRKVLSLFLAVMMVMTLCACSSGGSSAAGSAGGGETTSAAVEETETAEETTAESAGAVGWLGLTEEQQEEMFAYTAYYVNEFVLKPFEDVDAENVWESASDDENWDMAELLLESFLDAASEGEIEGYSSYGEFIEEKEAEWDFINSVQLYTVEGMFDYYHFIGTYPEDIALAFLETGFRTVLEENVTFSDEQLALGAEAAEKIAVAVGADSEITAAELGLTDEQAEEMYAYIAYYLNENYLTPNGIEAQSAVWDGNEINEVSGIAYWKSALSFLSWCLSDAEETDYYDSPEQFVESRGSTSESETFDRYLVGGMFCYYYSIETYPDVDCGARGFKNLIVENVTFSDEQLTLGAEVAEKVNAASAE